MTSWTPDLTGRDGLKYQALLDAIAEAIRSGALKPGDKLPPQRDLAWKLGMTVGTVGRAYALAEERRLVSGQVGRGTYVRALVRDIGIKLACGGCLTALTRVSVGPFHTADAWTLERMATQAPQTYILPLDAARVRIEEAVGVVPPRPAA